MSIRYPVLFLLLGFCVDCLLGIRGYSVSGSTIKILGFSVDSVPGLDDLVGGINADPVLGFSAVLVPRIQ